MINFIKNKNKLISGFTLVELVVVIGILILVSSIILFNYNDFNSNVSLENLSQDIALTIRQAQTLAIGVKGVGTGTNATFPGYGIHFQLPADKANPNLGGDKSFIYFADIPSGIPSIGNKKYDESLGTTDCSDATVSDINECLNIVGISSTDVINRICINDSVSDVCYPSSGSDAPSLDIVFTRPNPEAEFYFSNNGFTKSSGISAVTIEIMSPGNRKTKEIKVWNTGQISVDSGASSDTVVVVNPITPPSGDTTPPVITLIPGIDSFVKSTTFTPYNDPGATAFDTNDGDLTSRIVSANNVDLMTPGNYFVTYDVEDAAGNHAVQVRRIILVN